MQILNFENFYSKENISLARFTLFVSAGSGTVTGAGVVVVLKAQDHV